MKPGILTLTTDFVRAGLMWAALKGVLDSTWLRAQQLVDVVPHDFAAKHSRGRIRPGGASSTSFPREPFIWWSSTPASGLSAD